MMKDPMDNLLDRLIKQLDTLIPFIGISREDVFKLIQREKQIWFPNSTEALPKTYEIYRMQINHSAFVLGYSYFEAFLSDLAKIIFLACPSMLPNNKKLSFDEIRKANDYEEILCKMADKEIYELFYKSTSDITRYFGEKLQLECSKDFSNKFSEASSLRNCIVHNMGHADYRLAKFQGYEKGEPFELTPSQIHSFGIVLRYEARNLWEQACNKHLNKKSD